MMRWSLVTLLLVTAVVATPQRRTETGKASFYHDKFIGRRTANGERFDQKKLTCAHRTHKFGTKLKVSHGGKSVVVRVNDRGPFVSGRVVDLSKAAFSKLAPLQSGVISVTVQVQ